jgi:hypothetical protein
MWSCTSWCCMSHGMVYADIQPFTGSYTEVQEWMCLVLVSSFLFRSDTRKWLFMGTFEWHISIVKPTRCTSFSNLFYFVVALYMFRTVFPSIIRSLRLYIQHQVKQILLTLASKQSAQSVWHMPDAVCTVLDSWWWTERSSETCRVLLQNKINLENWCISLVLLQKYTTMHGPINVKFA